MPTSYYGQLSAILNIVLQINPESILDIGVGFGKYGVLCRELLDITYQRYFKESWKIRIDGIEGYKAYKNPVHTYIYDKIYYSTVEKTIKKLDTTYDVGLMIDILEHFEKQKGTELLPRLLEKCKFLIVSVPAYPACQSYLDNKLEEHKSRWEVNDFLKFSFLKGEVIPMGANNASIIVLLQGNGELK